MLSAAYRLRRSADFAAVLRRGRRPNGAGLVVVHALAGDLGSAQVRFGLIVSKAVGNSVMRHRVSRRLRALLADRIDAFGLSVDVVVRALPPAAQATSAQLGAAIDGAVRKLGVPRRGPTLQQRRLSGAQ